MSHAITATFAIQSEALTVIAAPPLLLSQHNVEAVTGIRASEYLDHIRAPGFPVVVSKLGKLRLVDCALFVAWVKTQQRRSPAATTPDADADGVDAVLAEIGHTRVTSPKGRR